MKIYKNVIKKIKQFMGLNCEVCSKKCNFDYIEIKMIVKGEINQYDFCNKRHAIEFLMNEERKENPRVNIEFGEKNGRQ